MGRAIDSSQIDKATEKRLIKELDNAWESSFKIPIPTSNIYVSTRHAVAGVLTAGVNSQPFINCVKQMVASSAETSEELIQVSIDLVNDVFKLVDPSAQVRIGSQTVSKGGGYIRNANGKSKKLSVGAWAIVETPHIKEVEASYVAEVAFFIWE